MSVLKAPRAWRLLVSLTLLCGMMSAADPGTTPADSVNATELDEISHLEALVARQQTQLTALQEELSSLRKRVAARTDSQFHSAGTTASLAPVFPAEPRALTAGPVSAANNATASASTTKDSAPLQLKIGDTTITPVGFMDLTNTFRSTNAGTSLQTNFGSIPYNNTTPGRLTEDKLSAANSRIGFRVDARVKGANILGYYEGDFVGGIGDTAYNTQVSSNSLLYRIRLYWIDVRKSKFEFLAGQSWSMLTPNRKQISPLPGDLFYSQVVDVNYMNGLVWGRIPGIRGLYHPNEKVTLGLSLENSSQYFGGSGGGGVPTLPSALSSSIAGELDQNVTNGIKIPNVAPDLIAKIAFDPSPRTHFEIAGVQSSIKLFNPTTQAYFTKAAGGGAINANVEVAPGLRLVTNNFWSDGEGRYLFGLAPGFIVRSDGSPSLIHSGSTVSGFEFTHGNTQLYAYYGGVYVGRNTALDANGKTLIGYGFTGSSNSQNKTTQEGTFGLTRTLWRDARFGALQTMLQYAYFFRDPWYVSPGLPRNAHENAVWFNLRYVLPGVAPTIQH
ncbi:MAG TPA: hypothetical protein VGL82_07390 [Bryobacteraceae bacterium]